MTAGAGHPQTTHVLRVMIADDDADVRAALGDLVSDEENLLLVGSASDAQGAVRIALEEAPDVAVLDVRMPGGGVHAARELHRRCPGIIVIALSSYSDRHTAEAMLSAGAARFLVKGAPDSDLIATIAELTGLPG